MPTYKNALDSLAGPPERMYVYQMKECLFLLCTFHMRSEKLTFMYFECRKGKAGRGKVEEEG